MAHITGPLDYHMIKIGQYQTKFPCDLFKIATLFSELHKTKINTSGMDSHWTL